MDKRQALAACAVLSRETRRAIVHILVAAGLDGLAAGVMARRMGVSPSDMSFHLKALEQSGLIAQARESRSIVYSTGYDALADFMKFLMEDRRAGHPAIRDSIERSDRGCKTDAARGEGNAVA